MNPVQPEIILAGRMHGVLDLRLQFREALNAQRHYGNEKKNMYRKCFVRSSPKYVYASPICRPTVYSHAAQSLRSRTLRVKLCVRHRNIVHDRQNGVLQQKLAGKYIYPFLYIYTYHREIEIPSKHCHLEIQLQVKKKK